MRYLSNIVTVTNLILRNIITKSNKVTNLVSNPGADPEFRKRGAPF